MCNPRHVPSPRSSGVIEGKALVEHHYICQLHSPPLSPKIACWAFDHEVHFSPSPRWCNIHIPQLRFVEVYGWIFASQNHVNSFEINPSPLPVPNTLILWFNLLVFLKVPWIPWTSHNTRILSSTCIPTFFCGATYAQMHNLQRLNCLLHPSLQNDVIYCLPSMYFSQTNKDVGRLILPRFMSLVML